MKSKNYLVRTNQYFVLSRGSEFECEIQGLALVHLYETNEDKPKGVWAIIDIASGLFVSSNKIRKELLARWEVMKETWIPRVLGARQTERYGKRVLELHEEKKVWRESGYVL